MSFVSHFRHNPERLRRKYFPKVADWMLRRGIEEARAKLEGLGPASILIDNTVLGFAVTHETRWIPFSAKGKGGIAARVPVYSLANKTREHRNASYLPPIVYLAELGLLKLWTSAELSDERFRQPVGRYRGYGMVDHSLFDKVRLQSVDGVAGPTIGPGWMRLASAAEQQRARLDRDADPLFR